jgi:hypothetical protein
MQQPTSRSESFEQYAERFQTLAEQANELGKADLAKYVTHRRTILDLVSLSLKKRRSDHKYPLERVLHKMLFPMGVPLQRTSSLSSRTFG